MRGPDDVLKFHAEALRLRAHRQSLLAANIANADTPQYKAVDIRFADALAAATSAPVPAAAPLARTDAAHLTTRGVSSASAAVLYRTPVQGSVDGNTVEADVERAHFADNTVRYEAAMRFLNHHLKTLLAAVQG